MAKETTSLTDKIKTLDSEVEWFYGEDFTLDQAVNRYKEALSLAKEIEKDLKTLKNQISVIEEDFSKTE